MTTEKTASVQRGRNRTLGVKTWLGAGALTLGVGAALAGATAVAQADTGHSGSGSASSSSSSKSDAGPKRTVATSARTVAKVTSSPAAAPSKPTASAKPAASVKTATAAVTIPPINQTINTPFGPISFVANITAPDLGQSGAVGVDISAKTPLGGAKFSLGGTQTFSATPTPTTTASFTSGTIEVPPTVAFAASAAGAVLGATLTAYDSFNTFFGALNSGNIGGAILAWAEAAPKFTNALLFGTQTLDLPLQDGTSGPAITAHVPLGGFFSPARSVSVTFADYQTTESGMTIKLTGGDVVFGGTKFGGAAPAFLAIFGI